MEQQPLISVIVPVYKVEAYLDRCVQSIVDQTYKNLEIILVDDGSPDRCPQMCDEWAKRDKRIRVIHKENGGLSDARNAGMAAAQGEYLGFVDSDDWIAQGMYRHLYDVIKTDNSDIAACGIEMVWSDGTPSRVLTRTGCNLLEQEEAMRALIEESWLKQPVWNKLYKTANVRTIPFPTGKLHEDVFWTYQAIGAAKSVSVIDTPYYFYQQRSESIMGAGYSLKRLDAVEARMQRYHYIQSNFPSLAPKDQLSFLFFCVYSMQMAQKWLRADDYIKAKKFITDIINGAGLLHKIKNSSLKQGLWIMLFKISTEYTCRLRNALRIGM